MNQRGAPGAPLWCVHLEVGMKRNGSEKIIDHMQGLLVDLKLAASQGRQYQARGSVPPEYWQDKNDILAKINLFWPFWRKQAKERGVDWVTLVRLESEMSLAKITLKGIGKNV